MIQIGHLFSSFSKLLQNFQDLRMIPSRIWGLLIYLLLKQLLCHNRLASHSHFKWLNSSSKCLNTCQPSETWDCVITQCSPVTPAILALTASLFTLLGNNEENLPNLQCSHNIKSELCNKKNKKIPKITLDSEHAHRVPCAAFSCLLCSACHRLHEHLHWGLKRKNKSFLKLPYC